MRKLQMVDLKSQYEKIKERVVEIQELKEILDIKAKSYNIYNRFKEKVLEIAERDNNRLFLLVVIEALTTSIAIAILA